MSKPWEELHAVVLTEQEFTDACNYKGLTCERPAQTQGPRLCALRSFQGGAVCSCA